MIHRTLALLVSSVFALGVVACAADTTPESASDESDLSAERVDAEQTCSKADYAAANELYKAAVAQAKIYNSSQCEVAQSSIAGLMSKSVSTCAQFSAVYTNSKWAAPVRTALAGNFIDGVLRGKTFDQALIGSHFELSRPGVGPAQFELDFDSASQLTYSTNSFDDAAGWVASTQSLAYTINRNAEDESAGWILSIQGKGAEGVATYSLRRLESEDELSDRDHPTYVITMEEDEEVIFYSYVDACSA